jgi:hypothetical protein
MFINMGMIVLLLKKTKNFQILTSCSIIIADKSYRFNAIWDTGASQTNISTDLVEKLNIPIIGKKPLGGIDTIIDTSTHKITIKLNDEIIFHDIEVVSSNIQSEYIDALIGMDIISQGDFYITHFDDEIRFDFVYPPETK